jgi:hypothetical protein
VFSRQGPTTVEPHLLAQMAILLAAVLLPIAAQHRCPGRPATQLKCPPVRNSTLWNRIHLHNWGNFICCGVLVRTFSCQVRLSSSQRLITVEPHPPEDKGQILFAVVFLSGHIAAKLECPPVRESPLWNHLRKLGIMSLSPIH